MFEVRFVVGGFLVFVLFKVVVVHIPAGVLRSPVPESGRASKPASQSAHADEATHTHAHTHTDTCTIKGERRRREEKKGNKVGCFGFFGSHLTCVSSL